MASDAATNAVILEVLTRHLKNEPHKRAEITINKAKHEITASELDFLIKDSTSYLPNDPSFPIKPLLAARIILILRDTSESNPDGQNPATELAAHIITTSHPSPVDPSSPSTLIILDDTHGGASQAPQTPIATCYRASTIQTHPFSPPAERPPSLKDTYRSYIATFMAPPPTPLTTLPTYLHQPVIHNQRPLSIPQYHNLVETVRASIPDINAEIVDLLADEGRGVVAARLQFKGTLVKPFAGVEPPAEGGGLAVGIGEIVFYWFEAGRIREVVSLVDLGGWPARRHEYLAGVVD